MVGRKTPFLFSFVLGDDAHGRYYFTTGHKPLGIKPPHWFRHFEATEVWKAGEKVEEWLDYTVFRLVKIKTKVTIDKEEDGAFWIYGLYSEKCWMRNYSTLESIDFWQARHDSEYVLEFMTQWLLAN